MDVYPEKSLDKHKSSVCESKSPCDEDSGFDSSSVTDSTSHNATNDVSSQSSISTEESAKPVTEDESRLKEEPAHRGATSVSDGASTQGLSSVYIRHYPLSLHSSFPGASVGQRALCCKCNCHNSAPHHSHGSATLDWMSPDVLSCSERNLHNGFVSAKRTLSVPVKSNLPWPNLHHAPLQPRASLPNANNNHADKSSGSSNHVNVDIATHLHCQGHASVSDTTIVDSEFLSEQHPCESECSETVDSKKSSCTQNNGLLVLVILLVIITLATLSALVYFVVFGNRLSVDGATATSATTAPTKPPVVPDAPIISNQTVVCGVFPKVYLPTSINSVSSVPQSGASSQTKPLNDSRPQISGRIVGSKPANIRQRPWQNSNLTNNELNIVAINADAQSITPPRVISPRVMGGSVAKVPWQVSLWVTGKGMRCGGSVILANWIVTAAHCTEEEPKASAWIAYVGMSALTKRNNAPAQKRKVVQIIQHPKYVNDFSYDYDLSLMKLDEKLTFSAVTQPICLPPQGYSFQPGMACFVSGWGALTGDGIATHPDVLQHVEINIISDEKCNSTDWYDGLVTNRMMCAGKEQGMRDACQGDSGGPLSCYIAKEGAWMLAGSVSWGIGCGLPKQPGVYARISYFTDWIWKSIGKAEGWIPTS